LSTFFSNLIFVSKKGTLPRGAYSNQLDRLVPIATKNRPACFSVSNALAYYARLREELKKVCKTGQGVFGKGIHKFVSLQFFFSQNQNFFWKLKKKGITVKSDSIISKFFFIPETN
jgi:hypothetical protein